MSAARRSLSARQNSCRALTSASSASNFVAATEPQLLTLGKRHEPRKLQSLLRLLVEFEGPFQQREGVLNLGPHLVLCVAQLSIELRELGVERLDFTEGIPPLHGHLKNERGLQHLTVEAIRT